MLANGDKLIVIKKIASFLNEGDIVEVRNVTDEGIISFAFGDGLMHMGVMNTAECESHFKKIEEKKESIEITKEYIEEIMDNSDFEIYTVFNKCTIVSCRLPNGFVITEYSACVIPENYDAELGEKICYDKIAKKIMEMEAYRLQQHLWEESNCSYCCEECEECECDECTDDECPDCDCDECTEYDCPFNCNN